MTREEYEARRRRLDEELRAALEMVKAGHQAQVQALDLLWRIGSAAGTGSGASPSVEMQPPSRAFAERSAALREPPVALREAPAGLA